MVIDAGSDLYANLERKFIVNIQILSKKWHIFALVGNYLIIGSVVFHLTQDTLILLSLMKQANVTLLLHFLFYTGQNKL